MSIVSVNRSPFTGPSQQSLWWPFFFGFAPTSEVSEMPAEHMYWSNQQYLDGERVPARSYRCKSHAPGEGIAHPCRELVDHTTEHRCICGKRWGAVKEVSA